MRKLAFRIVFVPALYVVIAFTGCNQHGSTLESVTVTPANQSMAKDTTKQFTAMGRFTNGMTLYWSRVVIWSSSDTNVATVSNAAGSNGLVTAVGYGTTFITALDEANNLSSSATLTVANPTSISITPPNPFLPTGTLQMSAIGTFEDGTTADITSVSTWSIATTTGATISDTGLVTSSNTGTALVTATYPISGSTGTTLLTVTGISLTSLAIDPVNREIVNGTDQEFTATGTFGVSWTEDMTDSVTWSSSNTDIAIISNTTGSQGVATSVSAGSATITATDPVTNISVSTTLTVTVM